MNLLWLQSGGCGGCTLSWLGAEGGPLFVALADAGVELLWHPSLSEASAGEAQENQLSFLADLDGGLKERMERLEALVVKEALIRNRWNKTRAATELGLSRVGLRSKLSRYGLEPI